MGRGCHQKSNVEGWGVGKNIQPTPLPIVILIGTALIKFFENVRLPFSIHQEHLIAYSLKHFIDNKIDKLYRIFNRFSAQVYHVYSVP